MPGLSSVRGRAASTLAPLRLIVVPRERAGLNRGVPARRAEHMARRSDQRGQGPRPGPVPRAPRGLLHPGALNGRGRERVLSGGKKYRRRLLILCAGLLPGAQIAERAGGLSPSWPGPRCARPRAHAPGTQRPAPLRVRRARAHRSPRLRAARDTHRARLFPWQARDGRDRKRRGCGAGGPGLHARARVKPAGASAETWRRARPPPQPSRPPPPPFHCRRVRVRVRVRVSPLRSVSNA